MGRWSRRVAVARLGARDPERRGPCRPALRGGKGRQSPSRSAGSAPASLAISGLAGEGDVVNVTAVSAAAAGLVVAEVDALRGFARGDGADFRGDVIPLVQGQ